MNPVLMEAKTASLQRRIRNAIIRAVRKYDLILVRGSCGTYGACGATWMDWVSVQGEFISGVTAKNVVKLPRSKKLCPACAVLLDKEASPNIPDVELEFARLLDLEEQEVLGFLQGWDGDSMPNAVDIRMFTIGRRLARELVENTDEVN